ENPRPRGFESRASEKLESAKNFRELQLQPQKGIRRVDHRREAQGNAKTSTRDCDQVAERRQSPELALSLNKRGEICWQFAAPVMLASNRELCGMKGVARKK